MSDTTARFHLDRRAAKLIDDSAGDADELLTTSDLCEWFGVTEPRDRADKGNWAPLGHAAAHGAYSVSPPRRLGLA